jgi:hypothetical protein
MCACRYGYAVAPAGEGIIGDDEVAKAKQGGRNGRAAIPPLLRMQAHRAQMALECMTGSFL